MKNYIKNEEMGKNSNQPHNIQTPTTVEEFRNNLKKYFVCIGEDESELYTQTGSHKIDELNSLTDLYKDELGGGNPKISVKVHPIKDFREFMSETHQVFSLNGYFLDEKNYKIIENKEEFLSNYNPMWIGLDNQLYREFFYLTLGDFSGYTI